ncbi:MAG TPA: ABC transporter permease [Vicinamibacteria bacterium]|nr:ABC transporter permease [Vicinamibacteria bacterium]HRB11994.1 ABC transporter permease [Vicinamibacteria bacterium]
MNSALQALRILRDNRVVLLTTTKVEIRKRHASSILGRAWVVLYPILLLSAYVFTFAFVLGARLPGMGQMDYLLFVFCGLVPYLGLSEAINLSCLSIRQNLQFVRNVLFPIELLPVRAVLVGLASQVVATVLLILLSAADLRLTPRVLALPLILVGQILLLWGIAWILSLVAVVLPDIAYFVNLGLTFLIFISPIGFRPDMVPPALRFVIFLNPLTYLIDAYRQCLFDTTGPWKDAIPWPTLLVGIFFFVAGAAFFERLRDALLADE